jgi:hypothetical protein
MPDPSAPVSSLLRLEGLMHALQKGVHFMSWFAMIMIAGWAAAAAVIGCFALWESGRLREMRERMASWRETSAAAEAVVSDDDGLESLDEGAA